MKTVTTDNCTQRPFLRTHKAIHSCVKSVQCSAYYWPRTLVVTTLRYPIPWNIVGFFFIFIFFRKLRPNDLRCFLTAVCKRFFFFISVCYGSKTEEDLQMKKAQVFSVHHVGPSHGSAERVRVHTLLIVKQQNMAVAGRNVVFFFFFPSGLPLRRRLCALLLLPARACDVLLNKAGVRFKQHNTSKVRIWHFPLYLANSLPTLSAPRAPANRCLPLP